MGLKFVDITIDTSALYVPERRGYGTAGLVAFDPTATKLEALYFRDLNSAIETYADGSGVLRSLEDFFANKGKDVWVVICNGTTKSQEKFNGDGSTRSFTLSYNPVPPLTIQADFGSGVVACTEGTEYDVDYGNKKIWFKTGYVPIVGTNNILADGYAVTATQAEEALAVLMKRSVQVVTISFCFEAAVLAKLKTHLVAANSAGRYRCGFYSMPAAMAVGATIDTFMSGLKTDTATPIGHNIWWHDPAAAAMGEFSYYSPQTPLTFKAFKGMEPQNVFTDSELVILAGDGGRTSTGKNIMVIDKPERSTLECVTGWAYTCSEDSALRYLDTVRVLQAIQFGLESGLTNPAFIGNADVDMSTEGMLSLRNGIEAIMDQFMIRPNRMIRGYKVHIPVEEIVNAGDNITSGERLLLQNAILTRAIDFDVEVDYRGSINTIKGVARIVPGGSAAT